MRMRHVFGLLLFILFLQPVAAQEIPSGKLDSVLDILYNKNKFMGQLALSRDGKIVYINQVGKASLNPSVPLSADSRFRIGSITKIFTATLIMKAVDEEKLSLSQTLDKWYPQIPNAGKITIGQLLNHRSGIYNFTDDTAYLQYHTRPHTEQELVQIIQKYSSVFAPGSQQAYSNSGYVLLGFILEKIYKKPYAQILKEKITGPLGIKNTYAGKRIDVKNKEALSFKFQKEWAALPETDMSVPRAAGNIVSTGSDLLKFMHALFTGQVVSAASLNEMKSAPSGLGHGLIGVPFYEQTGYGHNGGIDGFQSMLYYFPENKMGAVVLSNGTSWSLNDILVDGLSALAGKPFELPAVSDVVLDSKDLERFVGTYASTQIPIKISVFLQEGSLYAQAEGQSSFPLTPLSATRFEFKPANVIIEFSEDLKGMRLKQSGAEFSFTKENKSTQ